MNCSQIYQKHLKESVVKLELFLEKDEFSCTSYRQLTEWILSPFVNDKKNLLEVELFFDSPMFKNSKLQRVAIHIRLVRILGNFGSHKESLESEVTLHEKISLISSTITILEILIKHFTEPNDLKQKLDVTGSTETKQTLIRPIQTTTNSVQPIHELQGIGKIVNAPQNVNVIIPPLMGHIQPNSISDLKTPEIDEILSLTGLEIDEFQGESSMINSNTQKELNNDANEILKPQPKIPSLDMMMNMNNRKSLEDKIIKSPKSFDDKIIKSPKQMNEIRNNFNNQVISIPTMNQNQIFQTNSKISTTTTNGLNGNGHQIKQNGSSSRNSLEDKIIKSPKMQEKSPKQNLNLKSPKSQSTTIVTAMEPLKSPTKKENERDLENKSLIEAFKKNFRKGGKEQRNYLYDSLSSKFKDLMIKNHGTYKTFLTKNDHLFACKGDYVELIDTSKMQFKVFVSGLSKEIDSKNLRKHFESCGKVLRFARPKEIYAFLTYEDNESFQKALKLNGTVLKNCFLRIQRAKE